MSSAQTTTSTWLPALVLTSALLMPHLALAHYYFGFDLNPLHLIGSFTVPEPVHSLAVVSFGSIALAFLVKPVVRQILLTLGVSRWACFKAGWITANVQMIASWTMCVAVLLTRWEPEASRASNAEYIGVMIALPIMIVMTTNCECQVD